jgi:hypothetical protein
LEEVGEGLDGFVDRAEEGGEDEDKGLAVISSRDWRCKEQKKRSLAWR